jgi:hypothetical protein
MYGLTSVLLVFVAVGLLGALSLVGIYFGIPAMWRAWKQRHETEPRYRLSPTGEPGVHDELGSAEMRRTRRRIKAARGMDPRFNRDAHFRGALQIEPEKEASTPVPTSRPHQPGARTFGDRLSAWAWEQRN